jgi:hypothetical protein
MRGWAGLLVVACDEGMSDAAMVADATGLLGVAGGAVDDAPSQVHTS